MVKNRENLFWLSCRTLSNRGIFLQEKNFLEKIPYTTSHLRRRINNNNLTIALKFISFFYYGKNLVHNNRIMCFSHRKSFLL